MTDKPDQEAADLENADLSQHELARRTARQPAPTEEVFDRATGWPKPRPAPDREPAHPERIPDDSPGEFRYSTRDEPA